MTDPLHDPIERLLRASAGMALPDAGFSVRVMHALPAEPQARPWLKPLLVTGSAAIGSALAWGLAPSGISLLQGFLDLARLQSHTPSAYAALGLALAMAVIAAVLVVDEG
jgi:hypothetical protein